MSLRDWRGGELHLLLAALVLAVAAIASVGFLVDRLRQGLERDAQQLLGADLLIQSDHPFTDTPIARANAMQLRTAQTVAFPSMALGAQNAVLAAVKAVSAGYPLRGTLKLRDTLRNDSAEQDATGIPRSGTVWVEPQLLQQLHAALGDTIRLGERTFVIERIIALEPDRGSNFLGFAPRVMLALPDLAGTQLIQPASRASYQLLLSGAPDRIKAYQSWAAAHLQAGQRVENLEEGRPEIRVTMERAQRYLSLVALLTALLGGVAVALATRRYLQRHLDTCALLRCLGLRQREMVSLFLLEFLLLGLGAGVLGAALGYGAHAGLLAALGNLVRVDLPPPHWTPFWQALLVGQVLLLGFALPPLLQLRRVPPLRVLRRDLDAPALPILLPYLSGALAFTGLLLWVTDDIKLGLFSAAATVAALLVFMGVGRLLLWLLKPLQQLATMNGGQPGGSSWRWAWKMALAAMRRRPAVSATQLLALALGLSALLVLTLTRNDLMHSWHASLAPDAPNRFLLNLQPEQVPQFQTLVHVNGLPPIDLYPMVRGRLVAVNGRPVRPADYPAENAQRLVEREFNLSYMTDLPSHNWLISGHWLSGAAPELSLEQGLAKTLGLRLGDSLRFDVAGQGVEARVTSLRKVEWDSMQVNFFVIMPPALLREMPQSYIGAFHLPAGREEVTNRMVQALPNLTLLDTGQIMAQVQRLLERLARVVELLFLFTLVSGIVVIYAALSSSRDERIHEAALLRALGATARQLRRTQWLEFVLLGALAGLLAAGVAALAGWVLASRVFDFPFHFNAGIFVVGMGAGILCAGVSGTLGLRDVLRQPPLTSLRAV
ncbi:MAG: FtsX-like permease family protein [Burkholderiaceae bacterium]|nr:MAG: FtsX-like permease family protein [Burkholderiaceae bacterium]